MALVSLFPFWRRGEQDSGRGFCGLICRRRVAPFLALLTTLASITAVVLSGCSSSGPRTDANAKNKQNLPDVSNLSSASDFFEAAEKTADVLTVPADKAETLALIAQARWRGGDKAGAEAALKKAMDAAAGGDTSDPRYERVTLPTLAETQATLHQPTAARKTVSLIGDENARSFAYSRVITAQARERDFSGADATARAAKFTEAAHQYQALSSIAVALAEGNVPGKARMVASQVSIHWRTKALADVALALYRINKPGQAREALQEAAQVAAQIKEPARPDAEAANRISALLSVAEAYLMMDDKAGARRTLQPTLALSKKLTKDGRYDDLLGRVVVRMLEASDTASARKIAASMANPTEKQLYLAAAEGKQTVTLPEDTGGSVSSVARKAQSGDLAAARKSLSEIGDPVARAAALADVGTVIGKSNGR